MKRYLTEEEFKAIDFNINEAFPDMQHWTIFLSARTKLIQLFLSQGMPMKAIQRQLSLDDGQVDAIVKSMSIRLV